ncbi:zinc metallopeptidase [Sediminitomix flava]|uniref:Zinc metallopeptidase n=1 Tax=Sediminitomix flava TaxID=379075 RepID=A0A315Z8Z8_SEDFL|nr:zinc metallopeptidase [Sediminitomix flava]PWJ42046.1 hypothetical protein BC781_103296 [Sediminitomix flava]
MYLLIFIFFLLISWLVQRKMKRTMAEGAELPSANQISGAEAAQMMLRDNGIYDVQINCIPGDFTDHYDPKHRTVNLSEQVFYGRNVTAVSVATHEVGHAVQHAQAYKPLQLRSAMVPVYNVSGKLLNAVFFLSIFGAFALGLNYQLLLTVVCGAYFVMTAFSFITLPVEFDASHRALQWVSNRGVVRGTDNAYAKKALNWAAMTYVVSALASLSYLLYYLSALNRD